MMRQEIIGYILLGVSAVLLIVAAMVLWRTYERWEGVHALLRAQIAASGPTAERAAADAREALGLMPHAASALLAATDLADPGSDAALARLATTAAPGERTLIEDARTLGQLVRNEHPNLTGDADDPDQALFAAIDTMRTGGAPVQVDLPAATSPHLSSLVLYQMELLARTLQARDSAHAAAAAGTLVVLMPTHPDAPVLTAIGEALAPTVDPVQLQHLYATVDHARLVDLMLALGTLVPDRRLLLLTAAVGAPLQSSPAEVLTRVVQQAKSGGVDPQRVIQACLDADCAPLATPLVASLPGPMQASTSRALNNRIGDMAALALTGDPSVMPRCTPFAVHHGLLCFQCSNAQGCVPHSGITIKLDDAVVAANHLHQTGTLFGVKPPHHGPVHVVVLAGATTIADATVTL